MGKNVSVGLLQWLQRSFAELVLSVQSSVMSLGNLCQKTMNNQVFSSMVKKNKKSMLARSIKNKKELKAILSKVNIIRQLTYGTGN